jgi:uncharacterized protein YecA (UPF0149 family)
MDKKYVSELKKRMEKEEAEKKQKRDASRSSRTAAKKRYNEKKYVSVHVHLEKELVQEFKRVCKEKGDSQAKVIQDFMCRYLRVGKNLPRQSRNELCNCGSGRKYKHCCIERG